jgi:hypothetical protein
MTLLERRLLLLIWEKGLPALPCMAAAVPHPAVRTAAASLQDSR